MYGQILQKLKQSDLEAAHKYYHKDGGKRNTKAIEVALACDAQAVDLIAKYLRDPSTDVIKELQQIINKTIQSEKELRANMVTKKMFEWATPTSDPADFTFGYALWLYRKHAERCMAVRNQLLDVMHVNQLELIEEPLKYELVTLLAVNGRSSGIIKLSLTVSQGYQHSTTVGTDLLQKIEDSVAAKCQLGVKLGVPGVEATIMPEVSAQTTKLDQSIHTTAFAFNKQQLASHSVEIEVDLSKSCYVYQMRVTAKLRDRAPVVMFGGFFQHSEPLQLLPV